MTPLRTKEEIVGAAPEKVDVSEFRKMYTESADALRKLPTETQLSEQEQKNLQDLVAKQTEIQQLYRDNKDRVAMTQLAETLGNALIQIGAARYGMAHGVDATSGIKFHYNDWEQTYKRVMDETRISLESEKERYQFRENAVQAGRTQLDRARSREQQARGELAGATYKQGADYNHLVATRDAAYGHYLQSVEAGNTHEANQWNENLLNIEKSLEAARIAADSRIEAAARNAKTATEGRALNEAGKRYRQDLTQFEKKDQRFKAGYGMLPEISQMKGKEADKKINEAIREMTPLMGIDLIYKIEQEVENDSGFLAGSKSRAKAWMEKVQANRAGFEISAPDVNEYIRGAGVDTATPPSSPPPAAVAPKTESVPTAKVEVRNRETGAVGTLDPTLLSKPEYSKLYERTGN